MNIPELIKRHGIKLFDEIVYADGVPGNQHQRLEALVNEQTAPLEAEVKRHEFEAMERRADLQDLENENSDLLSQTEKQSINNIAMQIDYEALKQKADRLCEAAKEYSQNETIDNLAVLEAAITNYKKQE